MTGGARRGGDALEPRQDLFAGVPHEGDIERIGQPLRGVAIQHYAIAERFAEHLPEAVSQPADLRPLNPRRSQLAGRPQADVKPDVLSSGSPAACVPRSVD